MISRHKIPKWLRGSAFNPIIFIVLLSSFFTLDYIGLYQEPLLDIFEESLLITNSDVVLSYAYYIIWLSVICLAFYFGLNNKGSSGTFIYSYLKNTTRKDSELTFYIVLFLCIIAVIGLFLVGGDVFSGDISRQIFYTQNKFFHIAFSMLPAAFAIYCRDQNPMSKKLILFFMISVCIVLATNSRGNLILLCLIYGYMFNYRITKVRASWLFLSVPFVAFVLLWSRFVFRESWRYESLASFVQDRGGLFAVFFQTSEISMAEVITTISKWGDEVPRYPFESFVGALMYPLPRSIFEFKPLGAGGDFTAEFSPMRWLLSKSEIVTTGFGDLQLQFGFLISSVVLFVLSYTWIRLIKCAANKFPSEAVFAIPLLIWWMYIFLRSGIFNMGGAIWSALLVIAILRFVRFYRIVRL